MVKNKNIFKKFIAWIFLIVGLFASVGFGELFISGYLLNTKIIGMFPLIVHQIVGWIIIIGGFWGFVEAIRSRKFLK